MNSYSRKLKLLIFVCSLLSANIHSQTEDSDCIYEFNQAFAENESASQQLSTAQEFEESSHFRTARQRYELAIELLKKAIRRYRELPDTALDCSPHNLTLARENQQLAEETLIWAKASLNGLDCLKLLDELDKQSTLATENYYKHHDIRAAEDITFDTLNMIENAFNDAICKGEYSEMLVEQKDYVQNLSKTLNERGKFEKCIKMLEQFSAASQKASLSQQPKTAWGKLNKKIDAELSANICKGNHLTELKMLKKRTTYNLETLE